MLNLVKHLAGGYRLPRRLLSPRTTIVTVVIAGLGLQYGFPAQQAAAADAAVAIKDFRFDPNSITVTRGSKVTWTNQDGTGHTTTSDSGLWQSALLRRGESFSFTFDQVGEFGFFCEPHPWMRGKVIVQQPPPTPPSLNGPADSARLESFGPTLSWTNGPGATQVHLQVVPFNNDGPGVNVVLGSPATSFAIPAPPQWYGLLPDMSYTWRVRTSNALAPADPAQDASWTSWSERQFRTPAVTGAIVSPVSPTGGGSVNTRTPTLQWASSRSDVFYYEVQVSRDPLFGPSAFLYHELRHGGVTAPPNSYTVPSGFPLEAGVMYHWRVRPRVQGDGTPLAWPPAWSFTTSPAAALPTPTPSLTATATAVPTATPTARVTPTATPRGMSPGDGGY